MRACVVGLFVATNLVAQQGIITTAAGVADATGNPIRGYGGDGGPAVTARLALANLQNECDPARFEEQSHLWADRSGNIFVADAQNQRIRRIGTDGRITTAAGSGERPSIDRDRCSPLGGAEGAGDGGAALAARLYGPSQAIQLANGNLLICDQKNNRIRQVNAQGNISTVVGSNLHTFYAANIPANLSPLDWPSSIAVDATGRLYFAELHSHRVARVNADGRIQTVAGTGLPGTGADGPDATRSALSNPVFILVDRDGNVLVAEQTNHRVRRIRASGGIETLAGTGTPGFSGDGGRASAAQLTLPNGLALDSKGNLYIADMGNHRIRRVAPDGTISTVAGTGQIGRGGEGIPALQSPLHYPSSVAVDANDDLYISDWQNYQIRKVSFEPKPAISSGGIVNAASFLPAPVPLAPGALVSAFGVPFRCRWSYPGCP
jgi:trimeric autotransporter adhesin